MNQITSASKQLYNKRCLEGVCTRCGKDRDSNRKKCAVCRRHESSWRKRTRARRSDVERRYCQKNWDKRCVFQARAADLTAGRPIDVSRYVTPEHLRTLRVFLRNTCYYCGTQLQVKKRTEPNGLTVERLKGGNVPHDLDNCIICCHHCNCARVGNALNRGKSNQQIFGEICEFTSVPRSIRCFA